MPDLSMLDFNAAPYGAYVWPSYAATALAFIAMIVSSLAHARRWRRRAQSETPAGETPANETTE